MTDPFSTHHSKEKARIVREQSKAFADAATQRIKDGIAKRAADAARPANWDIGYLKRGQVLKKFYE